MYIVCLLFVVFFVVASPPVVSMPAVDASNTLSSSFFYNIFVQPLSPFIIFLYFIQPSYSVDVAAPVDVDVDVDDDDDDEYDLMFTNFLLRNHLL